MSQYRDLATVMAKRYEVDPALFHALIEQESGWSPTAKSGVGAYGLTQVMPDTARDPGFGVSPLENVDDPQDQLRFGAQYLDAMLDRYEGNTNKALAAYNWGAGNADKWDGEDMSAIPEETRNYISSIMGNPLTRHGPTVARAEAGLIDTGQNTPQNDFMRDEYKDNAWGRGLQSIDKSRAGLGDKLGINAKQMEGIGGGLQGLGHMLMTQGF